MRVSWKNLWCHWQPAQTEAMFCVYHCLVLRTRGVKAIIHHRHVIKSWIHLHLVLT